MLAGSHMSQLSNMEVPNIESSALVDNDFPVPHPQATYFDSTVVFMI